MCEDTVKLCTNEASVKLKKQHISSMLKEPCGKKYLSIFHGFYVNAVNGGRSCFM